MGAAPIGGQMIEFDGYYVHGTALVKSTRKVMYDGEEVLAGIDTLEIELHPVHGATHGGGSLTLRVAGKNLAACRDKFITNKMGKLVWVPSDVWLPGKEIPATLAASTVVTEFEEPAEK